MVGIVELEALAHLVDRELEALVEAMLLELLVLPTEGVVVVVVGIIVVTPMAQAAQASSS